MVRHFHSQSLTYLTLPSIVVVAVVAAAVVTVVVAAVVVAVVVAVVGKDSCPVLFLVSLAAAL